MKYHNSHKIPFNKLITLFSSVCERTSHINTGIGEGTVHIFNPEKGLQIAIWDCFFTESIVLYNETGAAARQDFFTLAYFFELADVQLIHPSETPLTHMHWDRLFISAASDYKVHIAPASRSRCLSISFSRSWLQHSLESSKYLVALKDKVDASDKLVSIDSMTSLEKAGIEELINLSWQKDFGAFYIKSVVYKIISDFLFNLKEQDFLNINPSLHTEAILTTIENYLIKHVKGPLPDLKKVAQEFFLSESTLKRHFKKKYGLNMSTFFFKKKLELAYELMLQKKLTLTEAALAVGYRNVNSFLAMIKKYDAADMLAAYEPVI